jgi:hypothetical protein
MKINKPVLWTLIVALSGTILWETNKIADEMYQIEDTYYAADAAYDNHEATAQQVKYASFNGNQPAVAQPVAKRNVGKEMKPIRDAQTGRIVSYVPYPTNWQEVRGPHNYPAFQGPNGIRVQKMLPNEMYFFNVDSYVARMSGKQVARPVSIQLILQQRVVPKMQREGAQLIKQYSLPEMAQRSKGLMQNALRRSNIQSFEVLASEWQKPNGKKALVVITHTIMHQQGGSAWSVTYSELEAPNAAFAQAKEDYLYGQANYQIDQQTAMAHNAKLQRMEQESNARLAASAAAHNAKMASREAAFQAFQAQYRSTTSDISDISMQGYWKRSEINDRMHSKEVDMIHERNNMINPYTNQTMHVPSGYNQYYINPQGNVIGSNNPNFNPNVSRQYNGTEWKTLPQGN